MFKVIFDIITDPLGLPLEWYYEWIILLIIGKVAYWGAYDKVGKLYYNDFISGRTVGSFFHWIIRSFYFVVMWAIAHGVIWIVKMVMTHKVQFAIGLCSVVAGIIVVKLLLWIKDEANTSK